MSKRLSPAQVKVWDRLTTNKGSFVKSTWSGSPVIIGADGTYISFFSTNTFKAMSLMFVAIDPPKGFEQMSLAKFWRLKPRRNENRQ